MKYTLLTAAALATVAIAAPAPDKALSLRGLGLGDGSENKAFVDGDRFILELSVDYLRELLSLDKNIIEVATKSKAKAKRGHHQGAQLVQTLKGLLGDVQVNTDAIDNILRGIRAGDITRPDGTTQCVNLLGDITGLLDDVVTSLRGLQGTGGSNNNHQEVLGIVKPLVSGVTTTVGNVIRTLGGVGGGSVGGGSVGSGLLTPVTTSLSNLLRCLLDIDPSLGTGLHGILNSVLGGAGTGTGTGGTGILGGLVNGLVGDLLGNVLSPMKSIEVEIELEIGGEKEKEESTGGSGSGSGSGSSGSGNESPVYNVPT